VELGVQGLNAKAGIDPVTTARLARTAEELGYGSWWVGDHVVLPSPRVPDSPMEASDPILDPLIELTYVAALTERIELATGILILPQRNPVVLAKQVASLDVLSRGRLLLGVAAGYLEAEMNAVGVKLSERGRRTDEYLDAMRALWSDPPEGFEGMYAAFDHVDAHPKPIQPRGPRIVIGGHSPAAFRRAVTRGHGWIGNGSDPDDLVRALHGLERAAAEVARPEGLGPLEVNFTQLNPVEVTADAARRYSELGVSRLLVYPLPLERVDDIVAFLERHAELPH
jgi:probable F420-dependent oxidoreductase